MEARTAFRGSGVSKSLLVVIAALMAVFVLGGASGYLLRTHGAAETTLAPATNVSQPAPAPAWNDSDRRSGVQSNEGSPLPSPAWKDPGG